MEGFCAFRTDTGGNMKKEFGRKADGTQCYLYILENENMIMKVSDYGAALVSLIDRKTGIDVVQGYDSTEAYAAQTFYTGASVGRTANRIGRAQFELNGKTYRLAANNAVNCLHGGMHGFNEKVYETTEEADRVIMKTVSPDGEEGYPGTLHLTVTYILLPDGVEITTEAVSDQDTLFAYTNHSYFNLDQSEDATGHEVKICSSIYSPVDPDGLTQNEFRDAAGTPFDFTSWKKVGQDIDADDEQIRNAKGYDHFFPVKGEGMRTMAYCRGSKLQMKMESDYPGFHFYSSNYLEGYAGKYGMHYPERSALCFEAEYMPNAVNYPDVEPKPVLRAGDRQIHHIRYTFAGVNEEQ